MTDQRSHLIFVSYRGGPDQNWATEAVYARMTQAFGADAVFKAGNALRPGEEFPPTLRREASSCPVMLACIGPGWLTATAPDGSRRLDAPGDWVREEIALSLEAGNHVLPLLIGNRTEVAMPEPGEVPVSIRSMVRRQALWLAPGRGLDAAISALVDRLAELVPELAERRRARLGAQAASTLTQRNEVTGNGLLAAAQDGSVHIHSGGQAAAGRRTGMPLESELITLAEAAAVALVTAMGTGAWNGLRDTVAGLFRRGGAKGHGNIAGRLDDDAALVAAAEDQAGERAALERFWRLRFGELVRAAPRCAPDLAQLIRASQEAGRAAAGTHQVQHTTVRDFGRAFVAQGGNVIMHEDPSRSDGAAAS